MNDRPYRHVVLFRFREHSSEETLQGIEKAFGVNMDTLMRMQSSYDIVQTRKRERQISVPRISMLAATR